MKPCSITPRQLSALTVLMALLAYGAWRMWPRPIHLTQGQIALEAFKVSYKDSYGPCELIYGPVGMECRVTFDGMIEVRALDAAKEWNDHRKKVACTAENGDHVVCSDVVGGPDDTDRPPVIPEGYKEVFYTTGCPKCAVGWVLKKGKCGDGDLNCQD